MGGEVEGGSLKQVRGFSPTPIQSLNHVPLTRLQNLSRPRATMMVADDDFFLTINCNGFVVFRITS
jgi:hypothetical protein